jgi:hypothetical protein
MPTPRTVEEVAYFAQRTAQAVRCVALRWWRTPSDPRVLQIEAQPESGEEPRLVILRAFIGEPQ